MKSGTIFILFIFIRLRYPCIIRESCFIRYWRSCPELPGCRKAKEQRVIDMANAVNTLPGKCLTREGFDHQSKLEIRFKG